jgi:multicomponent K+:H+ antiporter subunit F
MIEQACAALTLAAGTSGADLMAINPDVEPQTATEAFTSAALIVCVDVGILSIAAGMVLCLWRLMRGPTLIDRGVAADTFTFQIVALVVLLTIRLSTLVDFDAVLIVSILGFVSTVAIAQFIGRRGAVQ